MWRKLKMLYDFVWYDIPAGIRNVVYFFPVVWEFRSWDYAFTLLLFRAGLVRMLRCLQTTAMEVEETRLPKEAAMQRVITILDHVIEDAYLDVAEQEKGDVSQGWMQHVPVPDQPGFVELRDTRGKLTRSLDQIVYDYARQLEQQEWGELWQTLSGDEQIPGSDLRGWWA